MGERKKLTIIGIEAIKPPTTGREEHLDTVVPQLALRTTATGSKSFVLRTRIRGSGKQVRITLGDYPATSLSEARDAARKALNDAAKGINPNVEKKRQIDALKQQQADSIATVSSLFIERYAKKRGNKTWRETERILRKYVIPRWGSWPISEIRKADVVQLLDYVEDHHGIYMANRTLAAVRKMFNWALDERGLIEATPIGRKMARGREVPRGRTLTNDEIRGIWNGCDQLGYPFGPMLRLLLLTGQRRSEVAEMQWGELDLDQELWIIPGERTKNEIEHVVPLSAEAIAVIEALPRFEGLFVFSTTDGQRPVSGFSTFKRRADKLSEVDGWRLHDLRRTCRTGLAALNVPEIVSEKLLNHQTDKLVQTYNRYAYLDEKRDALCRWARYVTDIIAPPPENLVHLETQSTVSHGMSALHPKADDSALDG